MNDNLEKLTYRVVTGKLIFFLKEGRVEYTPPRASDLYEAEIFYEYYLNKINGDFLWKEQVAEMLESYRFFGPADEKEISLLEETLNKSKIDYYLAHKDKQSIRKSLLKKIIEKLKKKYSVLQAKKHSLDNITKEAVAACEKYKWLVNRLTRINGYPIQYSVKDSVGLYNISNEIAARYISVEQYRKMVKTNLWLSYYNSGYFNGRDLNDEQLAAISTTKMISNIESHNEAPDKEAMEDPDLIDGWILWMEQERSKDKTRSEIDSRVPKDATAVFIPVKGDTRADREAEFRKINELNTRPANLHELRQG